MGDLRKELRRLAAVKQDAQVKAIHAVNACDAAIESGHADYTDAQMASAKAQREYHAAIIAHQEEANRLLGTTDGILLAILERLENIERLLANRHP